MRLLPVLLLRLSLLVAIAASATLIVDYANVGDPAFCGVMSGCFAVRKSPYSHLFGVPLPIIGLVSYATLFGLHLAAKKRIQHYVHAGLASLGALFACGLLWLQKNEIGAFCQWCVTVDLSAIVAAISSVWVALSARKDEARVLLPSEPPVVLAWVAAAMLSIVSPYVWGQFPVEPPLPPQIQAMQTPGKLTIVGFTDFECPFCRMLHPAVHEIVEGSGGRVVLVRKMSPLQSHVGAEPAALAYLCAPEDKKDALADKLYEVEELTKESTIKLAAELGIDAGAMRQCVEAKETRDKLEADKKLFEELAGPARGLPFTFVGRRQVRGANVDRLKTLAAQGLAGERMSLPLWAMFLLLGVSYVVAAGVTLTTPSKASEAT